MQGLVEDLGDLGHHKGEAAGELDADTAHGDLVDGDHLLKDGEQDEEGEREDEP